MAILTFSGRAAIIQYLQSCPLYLAIGKGSPSWGAIPDPPDYDATRLIDEIGRKKLTQAFFVNEDDNGEIQMPGGRNYSQSQTPTRHLFVRFLFNYGEGVNALIREVGIFINTKVKAGLPASQTFFTPDQIADTGTLLLLEHIDSNDADNLSPKKMGGYRTVITI